MMVLFFQKIKFKLLFLLVWITVVSYSQTSERNLSNENWFFAKQGQTNWNTAQVPGTIHTDLLLNKLIPDPFYGTNEKQLQWIENENWEYKTTFTLSEKEKNNANCLLQLDGLDTYATVYLNNTLVLDANNMFRTWKIDVKKLLKVGSNELKIVFTSSVNKAKEEAKKLSYTLPGDEKVFVRKAQYQFGWDWGPRFVTAGIWKPVKLLFWNDAQIANVRFEQKELNNKSDFWSNCIVSTTFTVFPFRFTLGKSFF